MTRASVLSVFFHLCLLPISFLSSNSVPVFSEHPLTVPGSLGKTLSAAANPGEPSPGGNEALPLPTLARRALLPTKSRDQDTP